MCDSLDQSIAVWVGFLALFGIASDDGVVMATTLDQQFRVENSDSLVGLASCTHEPVRSQHENTRSRIRASNGEREASLSRSNDQREWQPRPTTSNPLTREEIRRRVIEGGARRVRPCLMTTATTVLALLPVLSVTGRGADVMGPMAIPVFGGMTIEVIILFIVPVLYSAIQERKAID